MLLVNDNPPESDNSCSSLVMANSVIICVFAGLLGIFLVAVTPVLCNSRHRRLVGGSEVKLPERPECTVPYIVIVEKTCKNSDGCSVPVGFRCAGTIISEDAIITAKQCVTTGIPEDCHDVSQVRVIAGANKFKDEKEPGRQEAYARRVTEHPDTDIDLAVINLDRNLFLNPGWREAALLPTNLTNDTLVDQGGYVKAAGWGSNSFDDPMDNADVLKYIDDLVVNNITDDTIIVSNSEDSGVSEGDSGGPIVTYDYDKTCTKPTLVGVINCPPGSCGEGPAEHVNVFSFVEWIEIHQEYSNAVDLMATTTFSVTMLICTLTCLL